MAVRKLIPIGTRFGKLTVVGQTVVKSNNSKGYVLRSGSVCDCNCGKKNVIIQNRSLINCITQSCGCLLSEKSKQRMTKLATKHNMYGTGIYRSWCSMKSRCNNPNNKSYKDYGARSITYDSKWETFENFWEDMGLTWFKGASIERKDSNGNYCKENCRWATVKEQANNTRRNTLWLYNKIWYTTKELCNILNVHKDTLYNRKYPRKKLYELED
jgi:hypothetical protein